MTVCRPLDSREVLVGIDCLQFQYFNALKKEGKVSFETPVVIYHSNGLKFQEIAVITITNMRAAFWGFLLREEKKFQQLT